MLRSDGVGNDDAKTREKILSWLSEKRPQKAWLSPAVVTRQNNSTRCSLRSRQIFRQFFGYAAAVLSPQFLLHRLLKKPRRIFISPAERERVQKLIYRLHVSGGHVSKTSLRLLLERRGCPVWMQRMVDQLQCDSCLESSYAQNAQQVSLAANPKL